MGLWIKNEDGTIERTAGGGADGADGQPGADGNLWHVGSGAPASTLGETGDYYLDGEDGWVYVKRTNSSWTNLYVNLTGPPGSGGDGGDFLPLTGGTVTGDLTVDGNAKLSIFMPSDHRFKSAGTVFISHPSHFSDGLIGSFGRGRNKDLSITSNGYPTPDGWKSLRAEVSGGDGAVGATQLDLSPLGGFEVRVAEEYPTGSAYAGPPVQFTVTESGPSFRAMPSKTRTVEDVLERAETAEFPPEDDEGVTTMDNHDEVPLFEVVSALLAKVKELSARIEALEGNGGV